MTNTKDFKAVKVAVLKVANDKAVLDTAFCFRLGLVVNRANLAVVRNALSSLKAEGLLKRSHVNGTMDLAYSLASDR